MIDLVMELRDLMKEKHLSIGKAAQIIGVATNTINRWLKGVNPPSQVYQRMIQEGMAKIKELYPEITNHRSCFNIIAALSIDNLSKIPESEKDLWESILLRMNEKEARATNWASKTKEELEQYLYKIAKRLNIPVPK